MRPTLLRLSAGLAVAALTAGSAHAQTVAQASTMDCSDFQSSPVASTAVCAPPPVNGLGTQSGASATLTTVSAGGDVFGAQLSFRSDDFAGAGANVFDLLTFSGATSPSQVFVYFLASVDASALSENENTSAIGHGEVSVGYGSASASVSRTAMDYYGVDPTITDFSSANLTTDGLIWRASFAYAGPGAFGITAGAFGELLALGGETPQAGAASGRGMLQLLGFGLADAEGNAITDASCSLRSQTPCTMIGAAIVTTPEPSTFVLLATALLGVAGMARRRRAKAQARGLRTPPPSSAAAI